MNGNSDRNRASKISRFQHNCVVRLLCLLLSAASLSAQTAHWEITPFAGFETDASVTATDPLTGQRAFPIDRIGIAKGQSYGLFVDYSRWQPLQFEFMWTRNSSVHAQHDAIAQRTFVLHKTDIDHYQFGIAWPFWKDKQLQPYFAAGLGFTRDSQAAGGSRTGESFSLGGGMKYYFSKHIGIRTEVRWIPSYANSKNGEVCTVVDDSVFADCSEGKLGQFFHRTNTAGGLAFRF